MTYEEPYMFIDAVNDYMRWFRINGKTWHKTKSVVDALILPEFRNIRVDELTTQHIRRWMDRLVLTPARKRLSEHPTEHDFLMSEDDLRKRKSSINRYLNIFKAILNKAYQDGRVPSDVAWKRIRPFRRADAPRMEYFDLSEITKFVNACREDLRLLVCGALYTGCRYAELGRMQVRDYDSKAGKIYVQPSKNDKARYVTLTPEGMEFFEEICTKKNLDDLIFTKADGEPWKHSHQQRPFKAALKKAGIAKNASFHSLRHTHASQMAMQGIELSIIAHQLGHSDSRMAERHYAHLAPSYVSERIRLGFPTLGIR